MASSLERGIEAAKSGLMEEALAHLKDAIIEEPENADVWVWLSAIIEDEDKQTIFLKKALEIDPGNRPAQRGLAFIERKKYIPPKPGEKLSDYTHPIGVFKNPAQAAAQVSADNPIPQPEQVQTQIAEPVSTDSDQNAQPQLRKKRKPWLDIVLYGFTLMVFIIIGILIGSTLLEIDLPFLTRPESVLETLPQANGVFLLEDETFTEMIMNQAIPEDMAGIPLTSNTAPSILVYSPIINIEKLQLVDENEQAVVYHSKAAENNSFVITPDSELTPGRHCLVFPLNETKGENLYWCLIVSEN